MTKESSIDQDWAARFETLIGDQPADSPDSEGPEFSVLLGSVHELLSPAEMSQADKLTMGAGTPGIALMEKAGLAVAEAVRSMLPAGGRIAVITGPGNNGGDGFVAARLLAEAEFETTVWMSASREKLTGDAAFAAASWIGSAKGLSTSVVDDADVIVDALFGAGLSKPITGLTARVLDAVNASGIPVISIDLPSGIDGNSGQVLGTAFKARETVTFFRRKPGHVLFPGREYAGRVGVADIGIADDVLERIKPLTWRNHPDLWDLPALAHTAHKYQRGHTLVVCGPPDSTGAARLAARGALRAGSGLVTIAAPQESVPIVASHVTAIMLKPITGKEGLSSLLADSRFNSVVVGPALGGGEPARAHVSAVVESSAMVVLDADALTSFADDRETLLALIEERTGPVVMTPHDGEFERLFPDLADNSSRLERTRKAADLCRAVIVSKGADTVVAAPGGKAIINDNAPPQLATAGSGDVLAGMIGGLLAQGMPAFDAAAAAVWLHGAAGQTVGRGLIAEDLPEALTGVFALRDS